MSLAERLGYVANSVNEGRIALKRKEGEKTGRDEGQTKTAL